MNVLFLQSQYYSPKNVKEQHQVGSLSIETKRRYFEMINLQNNLIASKIVKSPPFVPQVNKNLKTFNQKQDKYLRNSSRLRNSLDPLCTVIDKTNSSIKKQNHDRSSQNSKISFFKHSESLLFSPCHKDQQTSDLTPNKQNSNPPINGVANNARMNFNNSIGSSHMRKGQKQSE